MQAPQAEPPPLFVPAVVSAEPEPTTRRLRRRSRLRGIELEVGGVAVRVGADADPQVVAAVIRALKA